MKPDIYLMTSLLYVCAKEKLTKQAEDIFWNEIPNRNTHTNLHILIYT